MGQIKQKPHLYTKGGEKQYKDYEKNFLFQFRCKNSILFDTMTTFMKKIITLLAFFAMENFHKRQ
ncbi:MAG: hypothetical protein MJZ85_02120 [Bacteroidales bacterium]|nr:hypothetical protein [Bacteroidales bacterium]